MASSRDLGLRLDDLVKSGAMKTHIFKLPPMKLSRPDRDLSVTFEGVSRDEAETLIAASLKIEQERTGEILTPTEYRDRFSGLDITSAKP